MDRFFMFLVVHGDRSAEQEDCQCPKDVIPALQSLVKDLLALSDESENSPRDLESTNLLSDPLLEMKNVTPSIYFTLVEDKPFSEKFELYSKWHRGEHLKELLSLLEKPDNHEDNNPDEFGSLDSNIDVSERLHQLADDLPDQGGVPIDVVWFICGKTDIPIRSHLHLFGALKRLQQWHNASITVLCSNSFDRSSFIKSWQKGLNFSVRQLNNNDATTNLLNPSAVWRGSLVFCEGQSRTELPRFSLCCERSKTNIGTKLHQKRKKKRSADIGSSFCIAPEITILCKVQKSTVPFHMFLPVKFGLSVECSFTKLSARFIEWLSLEKHKDIALIGSLQVVTPSKHFLKRKNKEAWFNFVKSEDHTTTKKTESKDGPEDLECCRRVCLICGSTEKELSLFVLRSPEQLNGWIQQELSLIHNSFLISNDQEVGGPLQFPDLTDSFLETEQNLTEVLLCKLQQELKNPDDIFSAHSPSDKVEEMISAKWKLLKEKRQQLIRDRKEHQLNNVKREDLLQDTLALSLSPSEWPERAWLIKNDPYATRGKATSEEDITNPFPLITSVSSLSIQDILEKFSMDGTPARSDLVPVEPREESLCDKHIQICTGRIADDVKEKCYPEALTAAYHGIEYCLEAREAISKDSQLANIQYSHVKLETLSSCVQRDHKPQETRPKRTATKSAKSDKKQSLMKLSVPLTKTRTAGKGRKATTLIGRTIKRKSPVATKPATAAKRKREELEVKESTVSEANDDKNKETRSERHKRRLRQVVQKTLEDNGIDQDHPFYKSCTERLYSLCKSFLKDLRSSHGLNEEMKRLAKSNVQQVIDFETKRKSAAQKT
ncbi:mdm2-binding protein-like [Oculina patagonica]